MTRRAFAPTSRRTTICPSIAGSTRVTPAIASRLDRRELVNLNQVVGGQAANSKQCHLARRSRFCQTMPV